MRLSKSVVFGVYIFAYTLLLSIVTPIIFSFGRTNIVRIVIRVWARGIIFGLRCIVGITHKQIGNSHRQDRPILYVCNHQSLWETIVFHVIFPDVALVFKNSLYRFPIIGWYLRNSQMIAVDRTAGASAMRALFKQVQKVLAEGRSILIFPEGTRLPLYKKTLYHRGVVLLYNKLNLPVVPIAINSGAFWPPHSIMKFHGEITVSLLDTIEPGMNSEDFLNLLQTVIGCEKDRLATNLEINL